MPKAMREPIMMLCEVPNTVLKLSSLIAENEAARVIPIKYSATKTYEMSTIVSSVRRRTPAMP